MLITDQIPFWIIDEQTIFCKQGKPTVIYLDNITNIDLDNAISLTNGDFAITKKYAQKLKTDLSAGEFIAYRHLIGSLDEKLAHLLSQAIQLLAFKNTHQFCGVCGQKTITSAEENSRICSKCKHIYYPKIQPCIIAAITRLHPDTQKPQILLAKHHRHMDIYTLIAGFVEAGETLEMAVAREAHEEVGLTISTPIYLGSQPWPYPSNLMIGFSACYQSGEIILQEDELSDACFFDIDKLPSLPPVGTIARKIIDKICLVN